MVNLFGFGGGDSETGFAVQPGGGVDLRFSEIFAARTTIDYRRIFFKGSGSSDLRFGVGIVFRLGDWR